jgi:hypothetical protein
MQTHLSSFLSEYLFNLKDRIINFFHANFSFEKNNEEYEIHFSKCEEKYY